MEKTFQIISISSIFYVFIRFIISLCISGNTHHFIYYNITNDITWYLLNFICPIIISLLIAIILHGKTKVFNLGYYFLPILVILSLVGGFINYQYWGYFSKRKSVFSELKNANEILSITQTDSLYNDSLLFSYIKLNPEYYYYTSERPFIAMLENGHSRGNISDYQAIYKSKKAKFSATEIVNFQQQIKASKFIDKPENGYEKFSNGFNGLFIEFTTSKVKNIIISSTKEKLRKPQLEYDCIYTYVIIESSEISNDHYAVYEFLFQDNKIVKKQKFYFDIAGLEYIEYPTLAPFIEILLLVITFLFTIPFKFLQKISQNKKNDRG